MDNILSTQKDDLGKIRYSKNFLTEVIVRLDFFNPQSNINKQLPNEITDQIIKIFPVPEPLEFIGRHLKISSDELHQKDIKGIEWVFHSEDRGKTFTIGEAALFIKYKQYDTYETLKSEFIDILNVCSIILPNFSGKRLGLRYINNINPVRQDNSSLLHWDDYINDKILGVLKSAPLPNHISRLFHILEYNFDECNLRYQFGLPNSDYPAILREYNFVLDFDAYYQGLQYKDDIDKNLDIFHDKIQQLFEFSITDRLRELLHERG